MNNSNKSLTLLAKVSLLTIQQGLPSLPLCRCSVIFFGQAAHKTLSLSVVTELCSLLIDIKWMFSRNTISFFLDCFWLLETLLQYSAYGNLPPALTEQPTLPLPEVDTLPLRMEGKRNLWQMLPKIKSLKYINLQTFLEKTWFVTKEEKCLKLDGHLLTL